MQHECIPQAILGMDILCQAKSGMGKTAVFVLATLQQIEPVDGQVGAGTLNRTLGTLYAHLGYNWYRAKNLIEQGKQYSNGCIVMLIKCETMALKRGIVRLPWFTRLVLVELVFAIHSRCAHKC